LIKNTVSGSSITKAVILLELTAPGYEFLNVGFFVVGSVYSQPLNTPKTAVLVPAVALMIVPSV
jgi:hypothetical protein